MKTFEIVIKSHTDAPDYEDECEAETKEEAARIFCEHLNRHGGDWGEKDLLEYISDGLELS